MRLIRLTMAWSLLALLGASPAMAAGLDFAPVELQPRQQPASYTPTVNAAPVLLDLDTQDRWGKHYFPDFNHMDVGYDPNTLDFDNDGYNDILEVIEVDVGY